MEIKFPCGGKGRKEYCPNLCQYGKFCKIKDQVVEENSTAQDLVEKESQNTSDDSDVQVEKYY